jgi:two-component system, cell cycle sensor histidine kinase and response regulator CckA
LCKQLLAYAGKGRFDVHPLDLSRLVEEMSHLLSVSITHRASLELQLAADLPAVMGDVTQLRQVVMNLVINAAESVPSEKAAGRIRLLTRTVQAAPELFQGFGGGEPFVGEAVELQVIDNGSGMNTDTLARIFDPFFTTKFTGRGLGLAAVLGIVRSHQGAIRVVSEPGRGTMFRLLFPAATGAVAAPAAPTQTLTPWRGEGAALVIDDEESVRAVAQRTLEKLGFTVVLARDGQEGLEKFRQGGPFALVLLDLTMPRLNGEQTFRLLHAEQPDLPVLLMSGFNEQVTTERFGGHRLAGFVPKPFTVELLARRVREALARAPAASPPSQS